MFMRMRCVLTRVRVGVRVWQRVRAPSARACPLSRPLSSSPPEHQPTTQPEDCDTSPARRARGAITFLMAAHSDRVSAELPSSGPGRYPWTTHQNLFIYRGECDTPLGIAPVAIPQETLELLKKKTYLLSWRARFEASLAK